MAWHVHQCSRVPRLYQLASSGSVCPSIPKPSRVLGFYTFHCYSDSAPYLWDTGQEAAELEAALGVAVMRHEQKKPAGDATEVAKHFGCELHELVMVGDR